VTTDVARHRQACAAWTAVVDRVAADQWDLPTPCAEWDARALVEHVIGFHEFLLLRPMGIRAGRPREGPAARWLATHEAISRALRSPALDEPVKGFDGVARRPREVLDGITPDVLVHTWDLARSVGGPDRLDPELCAWANRGIDRRDARRPPPDLVGAPVVVDASADGQDRLLAWWGRDPRWPATS